MKVLIVDDAQINIDVYKRVLSVLPDLEFFGFTRSAEALAWASHHSPDLALVDFHMPTPNGLEFIEAFRSIPGNAHSSVVMVTSEGQREVRYRALSLGANDFLEKPVDPPELLGRAKNMLALADGQRKLADRASWLAAEVQRATEEIRNRERETINRLTRAAEHRDNETGMHIVRMGYFCELIGRAAGLPDEECQTLLLAAPMHDIGKVATPDNILLKPGKLDADEWAIMKQHTIAGYEILAGSESPLLQMAAEIALGHHEKFDGSGYPSGLTGRKIPLHARICAISDVFDALTSVRPYKPAWRIDKSLEFVRGQSGKHFDPELLEAFEIALPEIIKAKALYADAVQDAKPVALIQEWNSSIQ